MSQTSGQELYDYAQQNGDAYGDGEPAEVDPHCQRQQAADGDDATRAAIPAATSPSSERR